MPEIETQTLGAQHGSKDRRAAPSPPGLALISQCCALFSDGLRDAVHISIHGTNDLFDLAEHVPAREVVDFRALRPRWLGEFERALYGAYQQRMSGICRSGRRPDHPAEARAIQLLASTEQEAQLTLIQAVRTLRSVARDEVAALGPRIAVLFGEDARQDFDNPFDPDYLFDAVGTASRRVYPAPYIWRLLMRRVIEDVTPVLYKIYAAQNRLLADRNILPDIKARLRSRSPHRPANDRELLAAFGRLHAAAIARGGGIPPVRFRGFQPVERPGMQAAPQAPTTPAREITVEPDRHTRADAQSHAAALDRSAIEQELSVLAAPVPVLAAASHNGPVTTGPAFALPTNDDLMSYGVTRDLMVSLWRLQRLDLPVAIVRSRARRAGAARATAVVPSNLIPHIRAVLGARIGQAEKAVAANFLGMVFDYIFRDPAIPEALHATFERLQVPMLTAALLDNRFFVDEAHPARLLLEDLAAAAIAAPDDSAYLTKLQAAATEAVRQVSAYPNLDGAAFASASDMVQRFIAEDQQRSAMQLSDDVTAAEATERRELARSRARLLIRDRLAGVDIPQRIRAFADTVWAEYLASILRRGDPDETQKAAALRTLDDLCSTVSTKVGPKGGMHVRGERPSLESELRRGCLAIDLPVERIDAFLGEFRELRAAANGLHPMEPRLGGVSGTAHAPPNADGEGSRNRSSDFVAEMIIGTWVEFRTGDKARTMQLWFASPLRARYVFRGRGQPRGWVLTPEDIVHEFENGRASIVHEPVPLFERAIDAVFDTLGGGKPRSFRYMTGRELETTASWTLQ